jgi:hypothetical protein
VENKNYKPHFSKIVKVSLSRIFGLKSKGIQFVDIGWSMSQGNINIEDSLESLSPGGSGYQRSKFAQEIQG